MQRCPSVMKIGYSNKIIKILKSLGLKKPIFSTDPLIMFHSHYIDEKIMHLFTKIEKYTGV